jgi:hypothetical protein
MNAFITNTSAKLKLLIEKLKINLAQVYENLNKIYIHVYVVSKTLISNPIQFWRDHQTTNENPQELLKSLTYPLLAAVLIAVFLGGFFRGDYFSSGMSLLWVIREVMLLSILYFGGIYITRELIHRFGYDVKVEILQKLVIYSMIPHMVVSIVTGLLPFFFFLDFIGIYSLYVFWLGAHKLLPFTKETRDKYIIRIMGATWAIFAIASLLLAKFLISDN